ncbi:MAG: efflux RND transporter periplasmic adaptor subunit [Bacteroidota bacterium]
MRVPFLLAAALTVAACADDPTPPPAAQLVEIADVTSQSRVLSARTSGRIARKTEVPLSFKVGGIVANVYVDEGEPVRRGQILARLDLTEVDARVAQAQRRALQADQGTAAARQSVAEARQQQASAEGALEAARAAAENARADLARAETLFADSIATQAQVEDARTGLAVAEASVRQAEAGVRAASEGIARAEAGVAGAQAGAGAARAGVSEAAFNRRYAVVRAPADGVVLRRSIEAGQLVSPGQPAFVVTDESDGWVVRLGLPDRDAVRARLGDAAVVRTDAFPGVPFRATVAEVAQAADPITGTFEVELAVSDPEGRLRSGLVARVELDAGAAEGVRVVPATALAEGDGDRGVVFVVEGDSVLVARRREVRLLRLSGSEALISDGLTSGDRVVTAGATRLADGDTVRVAPITASR